MTLTQVRGKVRLENFIDTSPRTKTMKPTPFSLSFLVLFTGIFPVEAKKQSPATINVRVTGKPGTMVKIMSRDGRMLVEAPRTIEKVRGSCQADPKIPGQSCLPIAVFKSRILQKETSYQLVCTANRGMGGTSTKNFRTTDEQDTSVVCPGYSPPA